jgi:DNA helicase HerA-like ATPase
VGGGSLDAGGLDVGELVHAPDVRARLDARGLARHTFLVGQSGSGKTYTTGVLLEQIVRRTGLRLVVLDPNSDHVGLRETRDDAVTADADSHRARAGDLEIARSAAELPFATAAIGMRFSNLALPAQLLVLRLDPAADYEEVEVLLSVEESLAGAYQPGDIAAAAAELGSDAGRRLAVRIRALGIDGWDAWARDPGRRVLGDLLRSDTGVVVDTGSVADPHERSAIAAGALLGVWARRGERIPTLVVLDEAHQICPAEPSDPIQAVATEQAILIAGEGRKYGIFLLVATQRPQKLHPSVVAGCESLVLLRMNSLRDVHELEAAFSHVPEGLLRLAPGFARGEALVAGPLAPAPLHLRIGGRITPEGGGDVPDTWARLA